MRVLQANHLHWALEVKGFLGRRSPPLRLRVFGFVLGLVLAGSVSGQQGRTLKGTVIDSTGARVSDAQIEFRSDAATRLATSDDEGNFAIPGISGGGKLLIRHPGFAPLLRDVGPDSDNLVVQLTLAPIIQRIVISSITEDRIAATPNSQFGISRKEIDVSGSLALDDTLRQVPGFTLFRRSGSLFANPTAQGVSLRGVGANGTSRANVLLDGVPLTSPFGGWVYWSRVPSASIKNVEILGSASSNLYGSGAIGGVVNINTRQEYESSATVETSYGNENTPNLSLDLGLLFRHWEISTAGMARRTTGYILLPTDQRGTVDTPAGSSDLVGSFRLSRRIGQKANFFARTSSFGESRRNGTPLQINDTRISTIDFGFDWANSTTTQISLRLYGSDELFNQNFSAVAASRNSESLTNRQRNPSQQMGFVGQWRHTFLGKHSITGGFEGRDVRGHSAETTFAASGPTARIDAGGRQLTLAVFGEDAFQFKRDWFLTLGARIDTASNTHGFSYRIPVVGTSTASRFPYKTETAFSPKLSILHTFKRGIAVNASIYRAFRVPTLNELYRSFRVGNVVTNANPDLHPERLTGGDAGLSSRTWSERLTVRSVFFWSEITDPVANVTLASLPTLITRHRQNLGRTRTRGLEFSTEFRLPKGLLLSGEYLLTDSTISKFPVNVSLEGLQIPQVAKHQVNAQLSYFSRNWMIGAQARFVGKQFEDDQNLLPLEHFFTLDAEASRKVTHHLTIFVAAQNITGVRYAVGRTPFLMQGPPVLGRVGLRMNFP
jgi:outer membrane receptor protein involved in Fe transport